MCDFLRLPSLAANGLRSDVKDFPIGNLRVFETVFDDLQKKKKKNVWLFSFHKRYPAVSKVVSIICWKAVAQELFEKKQGAQCLKFQQTVTIKDKAT